MRSSEGSITKLGPRHYRVRVTVGYDPETGDQVRASKTVRGSESDARAERDRMNRENGGVSAVKYGRMSVYDFARDEWLPSRNLRPTTKAGYESTLRAHVKPLFSNVSVEDLSPLFVSKTLARIERPGGALNVYKMLKSVMNMAVDNEIVKRNPLDRVQAPVLEEYEAEVYTLEEVVTALEYVRGSVIEPGVIIAASCGLRASETCALDWSDVVLERLTDEAGAPVLRGLVDVREGYHRVQGVRVTTPPKSKRSKRVVALPAFAVERLLEIRGAGRIGPLMMDNTGQRMTPTGFTSRWRRLMKPRTNKKGVVIYEPPVRYIELKNLRHSQTTILLDLGATMHEVSLRAGHGSERVTDARYNKASRAVNADHSVAERLDAGVTKARSKSAREGLTRPNGA